MRLAVVLLLALTLTACGGNGGDSIAEGCADVEAPAAKADGGATKPSGLLDEGVTYTLVFETSCGDFEITLDQVTAPDTAARSWRLPRAASTTTRRSTGSFPDFVIQGGDPTGQGGGGPGYSTVDVPPSDAAYTRGVVAMAKTPTEPPGTSGSQFFVVTAENAALTAEYAIVGEVTKGYETVERIEALGDVTTQQPSQPVVVERVSVRES